MIPTLQYAAAYVAGTRACMLAAANHAGGALLKDQIKDFLMFFIDAVESWGTLGYFAYAGVYIGLEILAVPAVPLTMTAGAYAHTPIHYSKP